MSKARNLADIGSNDVIDTDAAGVTVTGNISADTFTDVEADALDLAAIAETKAVTAVDVFVYDTSKDSDGGAWRKRTQHTSWYNETLNTATRGARREFPAVAVIVATATTVTIYDGDDPSLPMWMVFENNTNDMLRTGGAYTSISFKNGQLWVGTSNNGPHTANFLADNGRAYATIGNTSYLGTVEERNDAKGYSAYSGAAVVNNTVNDVAMTVLPDAPIDPATGLPVPTIAVATNGGVSVITDSGVVWDYGTGESTGAKIVRSVDLDGANAIIVNSQGTVVSFDVADLVSDTPFFATISIAGYFGVSIPALPDTAETRAVTFGTIKAINGTTRLSLLAENPTTPASSMVAYATSTYNTGWMNGDIKGAFLSDTDDTNLVESGELVTNGTFDTDISGWTDFSSAGGSIAWNPAGYLDLVNSTGTSRAGEDISVTAGKVYQISVDVVSLGGSTSAALYLDNSISSIIDFVAAGVGTHTIYYVAIDATLNISVRNFDTGTTVSLDNVFVKLADPDRSVNANGLIINGTVTRTAVATGADLVAYSGFSAANYLEQPYNSDLDFGTGDFCVMGWVKDANVGYTTIMSKTAAGTRTSPFFDFGFDVGTALWGGGNIYKAGAVSAGWSFITWTRSSGILYLYVNGTQLASTTLTDNYNHSNNDVLYVGKRGDDGRSAPAGGLALWRISATAPTADQIKKIYEDEKVLFQENAQATLYGASDAVTALAHDPVTDLLHVGTSAGRSVFQGLRRVENTTDAVGTAISASNGLVVEE